MENKLQTPKGFRDFLPEAARERQYVIAKIREIFNLYGFAPLETPTIEYASVLLGKYGQEADRLVFQFKDRGDRELALRYDQTVPTARVLAQYQNELPKYFRRYQIQNVYRAEKPQKGRFREFTQCDIDIFGSTSPIADAEILACTYFAFKNVGYPNIVLKINDRQILFNTLSEFATNEVPVLSIIQSIDKLDKIGDVLVTEELVKKGLPQSNAQAALNQIKSSKLSESLAAIKELALKLGVPEDSVKFTPTLARGLDYYTGMIFEVSIPEYASGSLGGGGRYDNLIKQLGGNETPAVGIAFGFDRMVEAAKSLNLIPAEANITRVLVTIFDQDLLKNMLAAATELRKNNISAEIFPALDKLDKQLKFANRQKIPYVLIQGPDEAKRKVFKLKEMQTGNQFELTLDKIIDKFKEN